jgi:hypothetical protein
MSPITIGVIFFGIGWVICAGRFAYTGFQFQKYIKERYPDHWNKMVDQSVMTRVFFPFRKGTLPHFAYKSTESLNDPKIVEFRRKYRQHFFTLFVIYPVSFLSFIVLVVILLETKTFR